MQFLTRFDITEMDFSKGNGLLPVIIQDAATRQVLMQAYMNAEALKQTLQTGRVTFFSRSKNRLWTKGETSGNYLDVKEVFADCDRDCLLFLVTPRGPVCHTGSISCFDTGDKEPEKSKQKEAQWPVPAKDPDRSGLPERLVFLDHLENLLRDRKNADAEHSYTARLFAAGSKRIAKKLGEEAVELALEAENGDPERFTEEAADLIYHFMVLLIHKGLGWDEVLIELKKRHGA